MLAIERRNKILEILQKESRVVVNDLSTLFEVTEETIRRDLEKLEKEVFAKKTYGGAIVSESPNVDLPYKVRVEANVAKKQQIAEIVSSLIEDGDRIMLDGSSTAVFVAKQLKNKKNLTIITNSIEILLELSNIPGWKVLSTGGELKEGSNSLIGYQAENMIGNYHVNKAVISCKGVDIKKGITDSNDLDKNIKKLMLDSSDMKILVVDNSKFDKISFTRICELSYIDVVITDSELNDKWKDTFDSMNIDYMYKN